MNSPKILTHGIKKLIGQSAKAKVYLAIHKATSREVALKVMKKQEDSAQNSAVKRFIARVQVTANLEHPNIIKIHDSGRQDGFAFFSMEYFPLGSLRKQLEYAKHPLPGHPPHFSAKRSISIIKQLALALQYTHSRGYIHGNIKPENILLRANDHIVLSDFNITQYDNTESDQQHRGVHSDLHSLGVVFYELLSGENLNTDIDSSPDSTHIENEPSLALNDDMGIFRPILDKLLNKDPNKRIKNVNYLLKRIEEIEARMLIEDHSPKISNKNKKTNPFYKKTFALGSSLLLLTLTIGGINKYNTEPVKTLPAPPLKNPDIIDPIKILSIEKPKPIEVKKATQLVKAEELKPPIEKKEPPSVITAPQTSIKQDQEPDINCILRLPSCNDTSKDTSKNTQATNPQLLTKTSPTFSLKESVQEEPEIKNMNCILKIDGCTE